MHTHTLTHTLPLTGDVGDGVQVVVKADEEVSVRGGETEGGGRGIQVKYSAG